VTGGERLRAAPSLLNPASRHDWPETNWRFVRGFVMRLHLEDHGRSFRVRICMERRKDGKTG
jgi:hypothetical protein